MISFIPLAQRVKSANTRQKVQVQHYQQVDVNQLLLGDEGHMEAHEYSRLVSDLMRPSTPLAHSPHVKLLRQFDIIGDCIFSPEVFEITDYFQNAEECLNLLGNWFEANSQDQITDVAQRFVAHYLGDANCYRGVEHCHSPKGAPIRLRPVKYADRFQIIDGHHRSAIACCRGELHVRARVELPEALTPLQSLLLDVPRSDGRRELRQPVPAPEVHSWPVVHPCSDRLERMRTFLTDNGLAPPASKSYLDLGSSYGWFVSEMAKLGFEAVGVEQDPVSISVGQHAYGLTEHQTCRMDCVSFADSCGKAFDVVSCLSFLDDSIPSNRGSSPADFIRDIDRITGSVLFFETGQRDEAVFQDLTAKWDAEGIEDWLLANSTFKSVFPLGPNGDYAESFRNRQMLFACMR